MENIFGKIRFVRLLHKAALHFFGSTWSISGYAIHIVHSPFQLNEYFTERKDPTSIFVQLLAKFIQVSGIR